MPQQGDRLAARLRLAMLTGWAPSPDQRPAAPRGSGRVSLADALKGDDPAP